MKGNEKLPDNGFWDLSADEVEQNAERLLKGQLTRTILTFM